MNKYVIELRPDCKVVQQICESDGQLYIGSKFVDYFEELNSDYIKEHFSDIQDTAYKRGFGDGKDIREKGCEGCKYGGSLQGSSPCFNCSNYYQNNWTAKDDRIEVGDIVERYLDNKLDSTGIYLGDADEKGDYWNCLFWTGASYITLGYPKYQFKKTGRHFDIEKILEAMRHD